MKYLDIILLGLVVCAAVAYSEGPEEEEDATVSLFKFKPIFCRFVRCNRPSTSCFNPKSRRCCSYCPYNPAPADVCAMPKNNGRYCRAYLRRFFYNSETGKCETFIYKGCLGNANNFRSKRQCTRQCISAGEGDEIDE